MNIILASTEFEGIIKTGGLGDAIHGMSNALSKHDDLKFIQYYPIIKILILQILKILGNLKLLIQNLPMI